MSVKDASRFFIYEALCNINIEFIYYINTAEKIKYESCVAVYEINFFFSFIFWCVCLYICICRQSIEDDCHVMREVSSSIICILSFILSTPMYAFAEIVILHIHIATLRIYMYAKCIKAYENCTPKRYKIAIVPRWYTHP